MRPVQELKNYSTFETDVDYAIARHYKEKNHGLATSLKFIGNERVRPNPRGGNLINQLLRREAFWIYELNTIEPYGLYETQDLSFCLRYVNINLYFSPQAIWTLRDR